MSTNSNTTKVDATEILSKLRNLISNEPETNNSLKFQEREKLINELKILVDMSSNPSKNFVQKKKKKKKIKRQDLLREILEDSRTNKSSSGNRAHNIHEVANNTHHPPINNTQNFNLNLQDEGLLFDIDSHRFGVNLYNDNLFQELNATDNSYGSSLLKSTSFTIGNNNERINEKPQQSLKLRKSSNITLRIRDVYSNSSKLLLKTYLDTYGLIDVNSEKAFEEFERMKVNILETAKHYSLLTNEVPQPDAELLEVLGLPKEYNPYLIEGRPLNAVLVYNRQLGQFRVKHNLLSEDQKKKLKQYRNRIASRKFRKSHSKSLKKRDMDLNDIVLYENIIKKILPDLEELENKVKVLITENENLNEKIRSRYKQKLAI